ncbi:MAG: hypothetical protein JNN27_00730 [Planctomycetes bacterium]|nr:hypothetical protein [Planctomycetota bacterium]
MPNSTTDAALRARIESFTADLANLVRAAALEAVTSALGAPTAPAKRGPGRPVKSGTPSPIVAPKRRGKRAKRTPEDVAKMGDAVVAYVAKNPGQSVEQIKKALGVEKKDLQLPIVRMIAAKKLKTTGQKRGTKYFAAGGSGAATEPKRAAPTRKV